jgi:small nuclear ribonucleoprotein (snRNP)-like protein
MASFLRTCMGRDVLLVLCDSRVLEGKLLRYRSSNALRDPDAVTVAARAEDGGTVIVSLSLSSVAAVIPAPPSEEPGN